MATTGAVVARIVSQYSDKGSKAAQKDIAKFGKQIDSWSRKVVKSYGVAAAAAGVFAYQLGKNAVQGAMADQKQQASLAVALRNTTNATEAAIAANTQYLDTLELQVAIDNDQLIPALQKLVTATGNLAYGQSLLSLATDVSAASGKDLAAVSTALARAVNGNFTALTRLGLPLDENAVKTGNLKKLLEDLAKVSAGQASAAANTFAGKMEILKLSFNQTLDRLGYALLPVIEEFATYLISDVIPNIDEWVALNEGKLQDSFKGVIDTLVSLTQNLLNLVAVFEKYKWLILTIAALPALSFLGTQAMIIGGAIRVITKALGLIKLAPIVKGFKGLGTAVGLLGGAFRAGGVLGALKGAVQLFMMLNPYVRGATILIGGLTAGFALFKKVFGDSDKAAKASYKTNVQIEKDRQAAIVGGFKQIEVATELANAERDRANAIAKNAQAQKKADEAARRRAKFDADYAKINARIAKNHKVALLSSDDEKMVQINAAEALLNRSAKLDTINKELLKTLKEEVLLMKVKNDLASRYDDILKVLALSDDKLPGGIAVLAQKWGTTIEAVKAYILQFQIVQDGTISDDEVVKLAQSWGSTKEQAAQYLDFFVALNDGILDAAEIEKLKSKWKLTEDQVRQYADFVGVVNDGKLTDAEVVKLKDKWKLTTDEVVAYILKIGSPVSYSGTLIDPATAATIGWKNALAALMAYQAALGGGTVSTTTTKPSSTSSTTSTTSSTSGLGGSRTDSAASAAAYAAAKAAGDSAAAAIAAAGVTPTDLASKESGAIGALSIATQLKAAEAAQAKAQRDALANFKAAEALSAMNDSVASRDYDERFKFMGSNTMNTAKSLTASSSNSSPNITINVAGSVTSEQDLVQTVRNGLLNAQYNGNSIVLEAI